MTDLSDANIHIPPGNAVGCTNCGFSTVALNPNTTVTYEGELVLVQGTMFTPHTSPGNLGCGVGHNTFAIPLSDPTKASTANDYLIKINGLTPIHVGDVLTCGAKITEVAIPSSPEAEAQRSRQIRNILDNPLINLIPGIGTVAYITNQIVNVIRKLF
jgi:uncharacterized Zn-binding protein involved in type VI secretion